MLLAAGLIAPALAGGARAATFDGDSFADVFYTSGGTVYWLESNGQNNTLVANYNPTKDGRVSSGGTHPWGALTTMDLDGNGHGDLLVAPLSGYAAWAWYEADGDNSFGFRANPFSELLSANGLASGDFDKDGKGNVVYNASDNDHVYRREYTSGNGFTSPASMTAGGSIAMGYFDGDAYEDIFIGKSDRLSWYRANDLDNSISYVRDNTSDADGNSLTGIKGMAVGNGNLFAVLATGQVAWYQPGATVGTLSILQTFDGDASTLAFGDLDGDGVNELLVGHNSSAVTWYELDANTNQYAAVAGTSFGTNGITGLAIAVPVPEPAAAMTLLALGGWVMIRRRK